MKIITKVKLYLARLLSADSDNPIVYSVEGSERRRKAALGVTQKLVARYYLQSDIYTYVIILPSK